MRELKSKTRTGLNFVAFVFLIFNSFLLNLARAQEASVSLDLHGLRADEALSELDSFISNALLAGFDEVIIYHGIGTGKLALVVKEFLQAHKSVKSFADAPAHLFLSKFKATRSFSPSHSKVASFLFMLTICPFRLL